MADSKDIALMAGDTIYIAPVDKLVEVTGEAGHSGYLL